ncbi:MAG: alkaline shock response membrane anchor protein AmaP [Clostridiales bacterium]|nr:alkaline shock response membrane anchor protein AmaP [Clostridiales bacterium]
MSNEEMKSKLDGFKKTYSDFMMGNIDDEELAKDTTQPFWQSMYLSKKRLNNKGLDVDVRFSEEKGNRINTISVVNDGKNIIGTYKDNIIEEKSFKKDGRTIYDHKGKKMWIGNVIKARDENNMVACPNCGNMGDISSYINGCDYCNSRFQVEDFEEKVSSFVVSDDEKRKVQNISTRCSLGAIIAGIVMIIAMIVSFIVVIINQVNYKPGNYNANATIIFASLITGFPIFIKVFIGLIIVFVLIAVVVNRIRKNEVIEKNEVYYRLKNINGFVPEKFVQNLEYKLRNIHFAENVEEVSAFASVPVDKIIEKYQDIIECSLYKVKFEDYKSVQGKDIIKLSCIMQISKMINNKIYEEGEKLVIYLSKKSDITEKDFGAIRFISCENCGSSINILNGGVCEYCGTRLNYADYDWIIDRYYSNTEDNKLSEIEERTDVYIGNKKYIDPFKKLRIQMISAYLICIIFVVGFTFIRNREGLMVMANSGKYLDQVAGDITDLPKITDIEPGLELAKEKEEILGRTYTYKYGGDSETALSYVQNFGNYMVENYGYTLRYSDNGEIRVSKKYRYDKYLDGYMWISIKVDGNKVIVKYVLEDENSYDE